MKLTFAGNVSYKILNTDYCCEKLRTNPVIGIFNEYATEDSAEDDVDDDGCYIGMMIEETDTHPEPWEDYYTTDYRYYPIHYCPHCGKKIEVNVVKAIDVTEKYSNLQEQREELYKKCRKTDSKKKESEFRKQINTLDDDINSFYGISDFEKEKYEV